MPPSCSGHTHRRPVTGDPAGGLVTWQLAVHQGEVFSSLQSTQFRCNNTSSNTAGLPPDAASPPLLSASPQGWASSRLEVPSVSPSPAVERKSLSSAVPLGANALTLNMGLGSVVPASTGHRPHSRCWIHSSGQNFFPKSIFGSLLSVGG